MTTTNYRGPVRELTTDRLLLRAWGPGDIDFLLDMYSRWDVQRYIGIVPRVMRERDEAIARLERYLATDDGGLGVWAIADPVTRAPYGAVLLKALPASGPTEPLTPSGEIEIGWHLHPDAWGLGYAAEAAGRVLEHAFCLGLPRVLAVTHADNTASRRVACRIGMVHQGPTDRFYNTTCELFVAEAAT